MSHKEAFRIGQLPGVAGEPGFRQYSGYLTVDEKAGGRLFFWLCEAAREAAEAPLIIWMNGGPGASSMDGLLLENGPFRVGSDLSLSPNPDTWNKFANVLYLDQPVGTGFSYTGPDGYATSDRDVDREFFAFLEQLYEVFDEYRGRPLFLAGESFAGHYLLSMAEHVLSRVARDPASGIRLRGLMIGNGLFDPVTQIKSAIDYTWGHGLIGLDERTRLHAKFADLTARDLATGGMVWDPVLDDIMQLTSSGDYFVNPYDVRQYVTQQSMQAPYDVTTRYLSQTEVMAAIHAEADPEEYREFNPNVYAHLRRRIDVSMAPKLPGLLSELEILFYNGACDVVCNPLGTEAALLHLAWDGQAQFRHAQRRVWSLDGAPAGFMKRAGNLGFLVVLDAGHMVPMDAPAAAFKLAREFVLATMGAGSG